MRQLFLLITAISLLMPGVSFSVPEELCTGCCDPLEAESCCGEVPEARIVSECCCGAKEPTAPVVVGVDLQFVPVAHPRAVPVPLPAGLQVMAELALSLERPSPDTPPPRRG